MNTHNIELPPLPEPGDAMSKWAYDEQDLQAYARSAIEADRKRRGVPVATRFREKKPYAGTDVGCQYVKQFNPDDIWTDEVKRNFESQQLYTAPQPAEPAIKEYLTVAESMIAARDAAKGEA